jgi:hypothetical protein
MATELYFEKSSGEIWIRSERVVCREQLATVLMEETKLIARNVYVTDKNKHDEFN